VANLAGDRLGFRMICILVFHLGEQTLASSPFFMLHKAFNIDFKPTPYHRNDLMLPLDDGWPD